MYVEHWILPYFWWMSPKELAYDWIQKPLVQSHVNSGYTYTCKENNEIVIYREEEWLKVLIHESFHAYGLDFSSFPHGSISGSRIQVMLFNVNVRNFII